MKRIDAILLAFGLVVLLLASGEEEKDDDGEFEGSVSGFDLSESDETEQEQCR